MSQLLFQQDAFDEAITALRRDLFSPDGPQISTMRNYCFAIVPYQPKDEFKLRQAMRRLTDDLRAEDWNVLQISLQEVLLARIRATGSANVDALLRRERRLYDKDPDRSLTYLRDKIAPQIEGPDGIAADVVKRINEFAEKYPDRADRTLILLQRAGALYPFFRSSALLKHIDGKTRNLPVVLLYPGTRKDTTALSFMGELDADRDYRPRIYP